MQTFSKQERLCGNKQIDNLFATGESFKEGSFTVIWKTQKGNPEFPAQIMISIPKRNIAKANQRNLLKRLARETYRKQKQILYKALSKQEKQIIFAIIYLKSNIIKNKEMELEINVVLNRLIKQL
jgi:ribonuclease P protein component|tara:strand:+ start:34 stop:408 length:375 start_codon:yes stop_codon:yes gene_type:complete